MSRTEDEYRRHQAHDKGFVAGKYGDPKSSNPYKPGTDAGTRLAWLEGWEVGRRDFREKRSPTDPKR
jgi:ribosome modulation factor